MHPRWPEIRIMPQDRRPFRASEQAFCSASRLRTRPPNVNIQYKLLCRRAAWVQLSAPVPRGETMPNGPSRSERTCGAAYPAFRRVMEHMRHVCDGPCSISAPQGGNGRIKL